MRLENFARNEHYHVFASGVNKEKIFIDEYDKIRFIFLIIYFQSPIRIYNVSWYTEGFLKKGSFSTRENKISEILKERSVELMAFLLTPNHFHLLVQNLEDGILSVYMHRVLTAYSKYFNNKYNRKGHVFESSFRAVRIKNNDQLLQVSAYIHKSSKELGGWEKTYDKYPYSSYQDYIGSNRWDNLLSTETISKQFKNQSDYKKFVSENTQKYPLF